MGYGLAIIGYGGMGGWHHASIRERLPEITVKGAYDIRPEARNRAEEEGHHVPRFRRSGKAFR